VRFEVFYNNKDSNCHLLGCIKWFGKIPILPYHCTQHRRPWLGNSLDQQGITVQKGWQIHYYTVRLKLSLTVLLGISDTSSWKSKHLLQFLNGFPVNPFGQKHIGFPLSISHIAFMPHGFGSQGLLGPKQKHFKLNTFNYE